jgi:hypothetical protein
VSLPPKLEQLAREHFTPALAAHGFVAGDHVWWRETEDLWQSIELRPGGLASQGQPPWDLFFVVFGVLAPVAWRASLGEYAAHRPPPSPPGWNNYHLRGDLPHASPSKHSFDNWDYHAPRHLSPLARPVLDRAPVFVSAWGPVDSYTSLTRKVTAFAVPLLDAVRTLTDLHEALVASETRGPWVENPRTFALPSVKVLLGDLAGAEAWFQDALVRLDPASARTDGQPWTEADRLWRAERRRTTRWVAHNLGIPL